MLEAYSDFANEIPILVIALQQTPGMVPKLFAMQEKFNSYKGHTELSFKTHIEYDEMISINSNLGKTVNSR